MGEDSSQPPVGDAGGDRPVASRRRLLRRVCGAVALLLGLVLALHAIDRLRSRGRVVRGVHLGGSSLAGLDREGAARAIGEWARQVEAEPLRVRVADRTFSVPPEQLGFRVDVAATTERALGAGRERGALAGFGSWLVALRRAADLDALATLDDARTEARFAEWAASALADPPFAGGVRVEGEQVIAAPPRRGRVLDRLQARRTLLLALTALPRAETVLPVVEAAPIVVPGAVEAAVAEAERLTGGAVSLTTEDGETRLELSPTELRTALRSREPTSEQPRVVLFLEPRALEARLAPLREKLETPPEDARLVTDERDRVTLVPSRAGTVLSAERVAAAVLEAAADPSRSGRLPIDRGAEPALDTQALQALGIRGLVAKFTTFHPCCQPRVDNIHHAADLLDGRILRPGEVMSLNAVLGPRTAKNGFKAAPTIEEGEMVEALGGGVSQFTTTVFNALFLGGYSVTERAPHTFYFSRYPIGRDATLSWPKPDLIFENDSQAGLLIRCQYTKDSITVKLYGDTGGRKVKFEVGGQHAVVRPTVEYIPDAELAPEKEKVKEPGQIGWSVLVTRTVAFPDGKKREDKRKVVYQPRTRRVFVHPCKIPEGEAGHTGEKCPEADAEEPQPP